MRRMHDRIAAFQHGLARRVAERTLPLPHGLGLFCDSLPSVYDVNYVRLEQRGDPDEILAEADVALETFHHRRLSSDGEVADLAARAAALGWEASINLVMARTRAPDRRVDTSAVREVPFDELLEARRPATLGEPWGSADLADQLDEAKRRVQAAVPTRFLALELDGEIAAYCELRDDGSVAQIEDVAVLPAFRGRGLGRTIVQAAADAAADREIVFLEALADDWPRELYAKLGFEVVGTRQLLTKSAHPLADLRVHTPRLELRLATRAELRELAAVAQRGIHPPEEMPFAVAWTDRIHEPDAVDRFVAFHESHVAGWRADGWQLELVAFHGGRPIGVQSLVGKDYPETRTVSTGSWLGREWQGRGLGTEMRQAVLQLAFEELGAEAARSGAMAGNEASLAVSRKLGYVETGTSTVSPRGVPLVHHDLELRRVDFTPSPDVRVEHAERLRRLT
jgi:RimJ/RimL family protein N-acetyltransferase